MTADVDYFSRHSGGPGLGGGGFFPLWFPGMGGGGAPAEDTTGEAGGVSTDSGSQTTDFDRPQPSTAEPSTPWDDAIWSAENEESLDEGEVLSDPWSVGPDDGGGDWGGGGGDY